jgi:hypothetical protein
MNIFYAANKKLLGDRLGFSWISAGMFSSNPDLKGLQIKVKTTGLNSELDELINNVGLDKARAYLWQSRIYKDHK